MTLIEIFTIYAAAPFFILILLALARQKASSLDAKEKVVSSMIIVLNLATLASIAIFVKIADILSIPVDALVASYKIAGTLGLIMVLGYIRLWSFASS